MPVVKLTTTGRKSGKKRDTMLTSPLQDGDKVVLIASYGGDDRHPAWYLNLRDTPDVRGHDDRLDATDAGPDGDRGGEGRDVAEDRQRVQGLRRLPEKTGPGHSGRHPRTSLTASKISQLAVYSLPTGR